MTQPAATSAGVRLGTLEGIFVAPSAAAPMQALERVHAEAGRGLEGDRYFLQIGTYSKTPGGGREVTLIDAESVDALNLPPGATRRNLVTRGVPLLSLIGQRFLLGEVVLEGIRECPPCGHLEKLTRPGVLGQLTGRGGLRCEIRQGGTIRVGDAVHALAPA
jgi:MOSC domain-containing protein YiiM